MNIVSQSAIAFFRCSSRPFTPRYDPHTSDPTFFTLFLLSAYRLFSRKSAQVPRKSAVQSSLCDRAVLCPVGSISNLDTSGPCLLSPLPRPRRSSLLAICPQLSYEPASSVVFVCSWPSLKHNNNYARSVANIRPGPFQATGPLAESPQPARRGR